MTSNSIHFLLKYVVKGLSHLELNDAKPLNHIFRIYHVDKGVSSFYLDKFPEC
jgi:hypothetical protein